MLFETIKLICMINGAYHLYCSYKNEISYVTKPFVDKVYETKNQ